MPVLRALTVTACLVPTLVLAAFAAAPGQKSGQQSNRAYVKAASKPIPGAGAAVSYHETVEPLLKADCSGCHSAAAHTSSFNVESADTLFKGGAKFGAKVIVPGNSKQSLLIAYLRGAQPPRMPMNGTAVPEAKITQIAAWIDQGAKIDSDKPVWPYTSPIAHAVPTVKNTAWCANSIDNFILARLEAKGLKPSPPASKVALLRRVYADLVGVPPSPQEADAFLKDSAPSAYEKVVDRLLADPRYGVRWARHWLDLVRYADTHGYENDGARPRAWRYRDYVIHSFNADKPYDRFLKEQLAGDELYPDDPDALTATGYIRLGPWDELSTDHPQRWQDYLNDATDTTGSVMLGLTVGCARCHNHKYDRITQTDYYSMQSFFAATHWNDMRLPHPERDNPAFRAVVQEAERHLTPLRKQVQELMDQYRSIALMEKAKTITNGEKVTVNDDDIRASIERHERDRYEKLNNEIRDWEERERPYQPDVEAVTDTGKSAPVEHLLLRGNLLTPGPEVKPAFIASLAGGTGPAPVTPPVNLNSTGRRSALANWIGSADNPMTARVIVNRLWQHHFGRGIVGTPSDFGRNGDKPSHPELLDWLAVRFIQDGWSLKKMHRLMLLSNAYRQSTQTDPTAAKIDPTNTLLWRMNRIRLDGESLRDSILTVSGRLNPKMDGPGIYPKVSDEVLSTGSTHKWGSSPEDEGLRRTIYVFQRRSLVLPIVEAYDGADMNNTCPRRAVTTIAPQALALFNGDFSREESRHFAERVIRDAGDETMRQIERAYQIALVRLPTPAQKSLALDFIRQQVHLHLEDGHSGQQARARNIADSAAPSAEALKRANTAALADFCHVLINTNEFIYLD
jgi:hypothetical protein